MCVFLTGPAEVLFDDPYYESLKMTLKDDGIICSQGTLVHVLVI